MRVDHGVLYSVEDVPPWYLCILLGFQHFLTAVGGIISVPIFLSPYLCMDQDIVGLSEVLGTIFFACGFATFLQTTLGVRLPIVQGATFAFVTPAISILLQPQWACPYTEARLKGGSDVNLTDFDLPEAGSDGHREIWMSRMREIQGAIIVASLFQILIGFSGIMGLVLRFIGPLAVTPTISLIGISLFKVGSDVSSQHWWIALMTMFLIALFSQYLRHITIPLCFWKKGKHCEIVRFPLFSLFPVLLAMLISWALCAILTFTDVLPSDETKLGFQARTDTNTRVMEKSSWFRFPYPGQWGVPTVSVSSVFGMLAGVLASMVESVGDYYACARLSGAPPPPTHAVNRGIGMEGIGCMLAGAWGSGNGTTSYSENIGAIGITKVGSRRVVQTGGVIMMVLGCLGKFGALFTMIPHPIIGGMQTIMFGMVTAVGLSNLQYVDLNSTRNIFIIGISLYFGLSLPEWMQRNQDSIETGSDVVDQIFTVLLSTSMFVGGFIGLVLDNTIPGTDEERGIRKWRQLNTESTDSDVTSRKHIYDLPFIQKYLDRFGLFKYIPVCPAFMTRRKPTDHTETNDAEFTDMAATASGHDNAAIDVERNSYM